MKQILTSGFLRSKHCLSAILMNRQVTVGEEKSELGMVVEEGEAYGK